MTSKNGRILGKVAIVTGAASGIGRAACLRFSAEGANVVAADVNIEETERATAGVDGISCFQVDVTDLAGVQELVAHSTRRFGKLDALAHFAGVTRDALAAKMTLDDWQAVLNVNLTGSFLVAQAAAREMTRNGSGSIVLASSRSYLGNVGQANYAASKGGVVSLMRTLALEFGRHNVRVNAIAPGFIDTPMTERVPEKVRRRAIEATPLGRVGLPEEVAAAALFLISDESSFITGQVLGIDGGRTTGLAPA